MIPLFKVFVSKKARENVLKTLESGYIAEGPQVDLLEGKIAQHFQFGNVVTVNSCTSALYLALYMTRWHTDNIKCAYRPQVLTSPLTCAATNIHIGHTGYDVKWCDIDPTTLNISLDDVERKLDNQTRVLLFVHWGGMPIDYHRLNDIKIKYKKKWGINLTVIEDCAHAWCSKYNKDFVGKCQVGDFCCFSFQAIKSLTSGDGGLLMCKSEDDYKLARQLRWFGLDRDNKEDFRSCQDIKYPGFKFHMNDVAASIALGNFSPVIHNVLRQKLNANFYASNINNKKVKLLKYNGGSSYWLYTLLVENRERFIQHMKNHFIECHQVHSRNDKFSIFERFQTELPKLNSIENNYVNVPVGWWLNEKQTELIVKAINKW